MQYEKIKVNPVTARVGAEIDGVDLAKPMDDRTFEEVHHALTEHCVIFFRSQDLDHESHKDFGRRFGELHVHPAIPGPEGHPEILPIHTDKNSTYIAGERWHSDVSCDQEPPLGSILYLKTVPEYGGDTLFSNMYAAYDALSDRMKEYLSGLTARHDGEPQYRGRYSDKGVDDAGKVYPFADHPVVRTHPVSGRKCLFVNPIFTTRINGLPRLESDSILRMLHEHCASADFQVRFRWQPGSVAFWDNRCVQHLAIWDYYPNLRSGFRVTVKGDRPI
ncbi:MAG: taurine dioxygenase [Hyphomicrobiaceae bacterium TMED74]|nr:taurine dioxygenase [Filomicrobium sp.]RPG42041.1 MAG: taurine dioxygenase [Hyphomicrobiaceae bacterium TMED74]